MREWSSISGRQLSTRSSELIQVVMSGLVSPQRSWSSLPTPCRGGARSLFCETAKSVSSWFSMRTACEEGSESQHEDERGKGEGEGEDDDAPGEHSARPGSP